MTVKRHRGLCAYARWITNHLPPRLRPILLTSTQTVGLRFLRISFIQRRCIQRIGLRLQFSPVLRLGCIILGFKLT